jgi:hypothetical protein
MSFLNDIFNEVKEVGQTISEAITSPVQTLLYLWEGKQLSDQAIREANMKIFTDKGATRDQALALTAVDPMAIGAIEARTPEELEALAKSISESPENIAKISKVSRAMAKKVLQEAQKNGKWGTQEIKGLASVVLQVLHIGVLGALGGVSLLRTFTVDPAFLGARLRNTVEELPLPQWLKKALSAPVNPFRQIGAFSTNDVEGLFNYYKTRNASKIYNDFEKKIMDYNPQNMADELSWVYNNQLGRGGATDKKTVTALLEKKITFPGTVNSFIGDTQQKTTATAQQPTKVYSGIVAQGVLAPAESFTPQPKEIIESIDELEIVAHDNLAKYITSLPSRLRYQIEIVNRVVLPDGSVAIAATKQVATGTTKTGKTHYKNVFNKFAKLSVFIMENNGRRNKLDEIVLGSIDAITFQPTIQDLNSLGSKIQGNITTQQEQHIETVNLKNTAPQGLEAQLAKYNILLLTQKAEAPGRVFLWEKGYSAGNYMTNQVHEILDPQNLGSIGIDINKITDISNLGTIQTGNVAQNALYGTQSGANINTTDIQQIINSSYVPVDPDLKKNATANIYPRIVTVNVSAVNIRKQANTKADLGNGGTFKNGDTFQAIGVEIGENVNGENRWWKIADGNFVWVGGTVDKP